MRGHLPIIAMRRRHLRPSLVMIDLELDVTKCWRDWPVIDPNVADVQIDPKDIPSLLDLRWLIGLNVIVTGKDAARVAAMGQACRDHQAARVIAAVCDPDQPVDAMRVTDTLEESKHG